MIKRLTRSTGRYSRENKARTGARSTLPPLRLQFGPDRRFLELVEDEEAEHRADDPEEEHAAPAPHGELIAGERLGRDKIGDRRDQRADAGAAAADQARHGAAPMRRHRLGADGVGRGDHAADEDALNEPQENEDDRRRDADLIDGRQGAEQRGRDADADDGDDHGAAAAIAVAIGTEQGRSDRPHQERHGERGVDRRERQGRDGRREEQLADDRGDIEQNEQVEQIERPAQQGGDDRRHHLVLGDGPGFGRRFSGAGHFVLPMCFCLSPSGRAGRAFDDD